MDVDTFRGVANERSEEGRIHLIHGLTLVGVAVIRLFNHVRKYGIEGQKHDKEMEEKQKLSSGRFTTSGIYVYYCRYRTYTSTRAKSVCAIRRAGEMEM